jgi:hypothetical protein
MRTVRETLTAMETILVASLKARLNSERMEKYLTINPKRQPKNKKRLQRKVERGMETHLELILITLRISLTPLNICLRAGRAKKAIERAKEYLLVCRLIQRWRSFK